MFTATPKCALYSLITFSSFGFPSSIFLCLLVWRNLVPREVATGHVTAHDKLLPSRGRLARLFCSQFSCGAQKPEKCENLVQFPALCINRILLESSEFQTFLLSFYCQTFLAFRCPIMLKLIFLINCLPSSVGFPRPMASRNDTFQHNACGLLTG